MIVKPVYEPDGCDPGAIGMKCTVQRAGSNDLYWRMQVKYPDDTPGSDYTATGYFRSLLQTIIKNKRAITVYFHIDGAIPHIDADINVPLLAFSQVNDGPFNNALSIHPSWITPWTLGRKQTRATITIKGLVTDTHADELIQAADAVVKAITAAGLGPVAVRVVYNFRPAHDLITSMETFDNQIQQGRSGDAPLLNPEIDVYPAFLKSIDVSQVGIFVGHSDQLFQIVVDWQRSIFVQPISMGWLSSKVLQTPDDDPGIVDNTSAPHTFSSVISSDPTVAAWKAGTPIPKSVCNRIMQLAREGGLAPVDQVILTLSWLQNQSWDTDISLHDSSDSCASAISEVVNTPDFPKGATSVSSMLASTVKPRPETELANRSGDASSEAFLAFQKTLSGTATDDNRLASNVTVSVTQPIKELDDFLSLANKSGNASATIDADKLRTLLAEQPPQNPLVLNNSKKNCFSYEANAASNEIKFQCMSLKRADGSSAPLDVVILTDMPVFTDGGVAKIQSIQFSLSQSGSQVALR